MEAVQPGRYHRTEPILTLDLIEKLEEKKAQMKKEHDELNKPLPPEYYRQLIKKQESSRGIKFVFALLAIIIIIYLAWTLCLTYPANAAKILGVSDCQGAACNTCESVLGRFFKKAGNSTSQLATGLGTIGLKSCTGNISSGTCLSTKPSYCNDGAIENRSDLCGCDANLRPYNQSCIPIVYCPDGSMSPDCSQNKPYQCLNGTLIENANTCGCTESYMAQGEKCVPIQRCADDTIYGQCSSNKPLYCLDGTLIERASDCGCPEGMNIESIGDRNSDRCVPSQTSTGSVVQTNTPPIDSGNPSVYSLETRVHDLINAQRAGNGLAGLSSDQALASIARKHSQDMNMRNFFDHVNPDGQDPTARGASAGYSCHKNYGSYYMVGIAENIFQTWTYGTTTYMNGVVVGKDYLTEDQIANQIVDGWMHSPGHRQNILTPTYDREGIGVDISGEGKIEVTEDFC